MAIPTTVVLRQGSRLQPHHHHTAFVRVVRTLSLQDNKKSTHRSKVVIFASISFATRPIPFLFCPLSEWKTECGQIQSSLAYGFGHTSKRIEQHRRLFFDSPTQDVTQELRLLRVQTTSIRRIVPATVVEKRDYLIEKRHCQVDFCDSRSTEPTSLDLLYQPNTSTHTNARSLGAISMKICIATLLTMVATTSAAAIDTAAAAAQVGDVVRGVSYGAGSVVRDGISGAAMSFSAQKGVMALKAPLARIKLVDEADSTSTTTAQKSVSENEDDGEIAYLPTSGAAAINAALKASYVAGAPVRGRRFGRDAEVDARRRRAIAVLAR